MPILKLTREQEQETFEESHAYYVDNQVHYNGKGNLKLYHLLLHPPHPDLK